jgi:hypothetical protein
MAGDLQEKVPNNKTLSQVKKKKGTRTFWSELMDVNNMFLERGRFSVQDGTQTRFWEDLWLGDEPLMKKYASLYNITRKKNVTVAQVLITGKLNISFRGAVVEWLELVGVLLGVRFNK